MASVLKLRRGNSVSHSGFTGAQGEVTFNTDTKELVAHDGSTVGGFPSLGSKTLAAAGGASLVGYISPVIGAENTTVAAKLANVNSVTDFGAHSTESTGFAAFDSTAAIQAAVAHCYLIGASLYWPSGTFKVVGNIPDFFKVQHYGDGSIIREATTFKIEPGDADTNVIFISSTGADSNDGLSANFPARTLSRVKVILVGTTPNQRGGVWEIRFAAGTYSDSTNFTDLPIFRNAIRFIGAGTSRTPLTIFDGAVAAYQTAGMYFMNRTSVFLQYLKFINFTTGYGALAERNCQIELVDCTAENCLIGFAAGYSSYIRTTRCLALNCTGTGFRASSNGQAAFVPSTGLLVDGNKAEGCGYGFTITRNSYAHIDFNEMTDCVYGGVLVEINSRTALLANNFKRNAVAVRCWTSGFISLNNPDQANIYNEGTVNANTEVYEFRGASGIVNLHGQHGTMETTILTDTTTRTVTNTLIGTEVRGGIFTAPAGWFIDSSKRVRFSVRGVVTNPADSTVSLQLKAGSSALTLTSVSANVTAQPFFFDVEVTPTASNAQKILSKLTINGVLPTVEYRTTALDFATSDLVFEFFSDASGTGGLSSSITYESIEFSISG